MSWISKHPIATGAVVLGGLYLLAAAQKRKQQSLVGTVAGTGSHLPPQRRNPTTVASAVVQ